jgi:hypothetical protein
MRKPKSFFLILFCGAILASLLSSCATVVGYYVGSTLGTHDSVAVFPDIDAVKNKRVRINYNDTTIRYAHYEGYDDEPAGQYHERYMAFMHAHPDNDESISLGSPIAISTVFRKARKSNLFAGYFPEGILLDSEQHGSKVFLDEIKTISRIDSGKELSHTDVMTMFTSNTIPIRGKFNFYYYDEFQNKRQFSLVNTDFQNAFTAGRSSPWRWVGAAVGLPVDIVLLGLVFKNLIRSKNSWSTY